VNLLEDIRLAFHQAAKGIFEVQDKAANELKTSGLQWPCVARDEGKVHNVLPVDHAFLAVAVSRLSCAGGGGNCRDQLIE
jgi:hypothetical protein